MTRKKDETTAVTELEAAVLGVVWQQGPCTPYAIRRHFLESPAPRWSGSAGAIYPLVRRLETRGLIRSKSNTQGRRERRDYRITRLGTTALKRWLKIPIAHSDSTLIHDPLRTRMLFMRALPRETAQSVVSEALEELRRTLQETQRDVRESRKRDDPFAYLAARNALLVTKARVNWLTEAQAQITATGTGCKAAIDAERWLAKQGIE